MPFPAWLRTVTRTTPHLCTHVRPAVLQDASLPDHVGGGGIGTTTSHAGLSTWTVHGPHMDGLSTWTVHEMDIWISHVWTVYVDSPWTAYVVSPPWTVHVVSPLLRPLRTYRTAYSSPVPLLVSLVRCVFNPSSEVVKYPPSLALCQASLVSLVVHTPSDTHVPDPTRSVRAC